MENKQVTGKQAISNALSRQISWLESWRTKDGAHNGYVIHRHDLKRMFKIHDTPWSQGPIINGYLNLYKKANDNKWLEKAIQSADLQCKRLHKTGKYIYAGFEDGRFSSLVHNSLANCALLNMAKVLIENNHDEKAQIYLKTAKKNIEEYIIKVLWNEEFGAFKFSEIDYYSPDTTRFVVNMNSVATESLIKLSRLTNEKKYQKYAIRVGEWMLTEQISSSSLGSGGINYSQIDSGVSISIYTALALSGMDDLYYLTKDQRYLDMAKNAASHLVNLIDDETKLFYHAVINGNVVKYPQFVAGSGIILKALHDVEQLTGNKYNYQDTLNLILEKQLSGGGFSNFVGYNSRDNYRKKGNLMVVWEDIVPIVGWNAHLFEFLTRITQKDFSYKPIRFKTYHLIAQNYFYWENEHSVFILGRKPLKSLVLFFMIKNVNFALFYISALPMMKLLIRIKQCFFSNKSVKEKQ